ncbi:MAG: SRPBCC family protein [Solirubrobacteraceae bacterium]
MTLLRGSTSAEIAAAIERCWSVVEDVARWPEWQHGLESVDVLERDGAGRAVLCDTLSDARFTKVRCRVAVIYEPPRRITWSWVAADSDDLDAMDGSWVLDELPGDRTRATYALAVDPGPVGFMARPLERALRPLVVGRRADELARAVLGAISG